MMESLSTPFFMRQDMLEQIQKRVDSLSKGYRQNMAIVGPEGMGKTPFLTHLHSSLVSQNNIFPIYVDVRSALDFESLVNKWVGSLLLGYFSKTSGGVSFDLDLLLEKAKDQIPSTVAAIKEMRKQVRREKNTLAVRMLFALTGVLQQETNQQVVLFLDEFDALEDLPTSDPFAILGKEIMIQTNTLYLVTSSKVNRAREIFNSKLSLLFGNFEMIHFDPLGFQQAIDFLKWQMPECLFSKEQKDFFLRMTDGNPFYLRLIAEELNSRIRMGSSAPLRSETMFSVSDHHLVESFQSELMDHRGRLALIFEKRLDYCRRLVKEGSSYVKVLLALSHGRRKLAQIASYIEKSTTEAKKILDRLLKEEILVKKGSVYCLEDPLFRFWLVEVFEKKSHAFLPEENMIRLHLYESLRRELERSRSLVSMEPLRRIQRLLEEFHNDVIILDEKRIKCPQFTDISYKPSAGHQFPLFAKGPKSRWLCQVALGKTTEQDVVDFIEESKRFRRRKPQAIFLILRGIDQNARLMAQEAKIQLWDLKTLNALLDLYGLPKMVLFREIEQKILPQFQNI